MCMLYNSYYLQQPMGQPGKVVNLARGQLNRKNGFYTVSPFAPERLVSRDRFGSPVSRLLKAIHLLIVITHHRIDSSSFPRRRLSCIPVVGRHRVTPEFIMSHKCVPMTVTAERSPAQGQYSLQGSSSIGCCLFRYHHESGFLCVSLPTPTNTIGKRFILFYFIFLYLILG